MVLIPSRDLLVRFPDRAKFMFQTENDCELNYVDKIKIVIYSYIVKKILPLELYVNDDNASILLKILSVLFGMS